MEAKDVCVHLLEKAMDPPEHCRLVPHNLMHVTDDGQFGRPWGQPVYPLTMRFFMFEQKQQ
jgi:hypothetical protein